MAYTIDESNGDIVIGGFQNGIGDSPYSGISDAKGVNISSIASEASVAFSTQSILQAPNTGSQTTSVLASGGLLLIPTALAVESYQWVIFTSVGTSGLSLATPYFIFYYGTSEANTEYTLYTTFEGSSAVTISNNSAVTWYTIAPSAINFFDKSLGNNFALDSNGRVWSDLALTGTGGGISTSSWTYIGNTTLTNASGNGMVVYRTVHDGTGGSTTPPTVDETLFVFRNSAIDYLPLTSGGANATPYTWNYGWNPATGTTAQSTYLHTLGGQPNPHHAIVAPDNRVYFTDANFIWCFYQNVPLPGNNYVGFSPTNSGQIFALTQNLYLNAVAAVLSSSWSRSSGVYLATFSDNEQRYVTFTNGSTAISWTTGLTGAVNANIQVGTSYTFSTYTILPFNDTAQCLAFLNQYILIGGKNNIVYPWDLTSPTYSTPLIQLPETNIQAMITVGQNGYIFAGNRGNIYQTNGSQASFYKKVPDYISNQVEPIFTWGNLASSIGVSPQCVAYNKNRLYFGISGSYQAGSNVSNYGGLWCLDLTSNALYQQQQMSYGTWNGFISALSSDTVKSLYGPTFGFGLMMGWSDGSGNNFGVDVDIKTPYTNSHSWITSDIIPIGTLLKPTTPLQFEIKLSKPIVSGETAQILIGSYLDTSYASFQSAGTMTYSAGQPNISYNTSANLTNPGSPIEQMQWLVVQVILTSVSSNPSYCRLTEIRILGAGIKQSALYNIQ